MKRRQLPSPPNTYVFEQERTCPVCDGTEGEMDTWVKYKDLDRENLPLLRFLKGKSPNPDK